MKEVYFSEFIENNFDVSKIVIFTHEYATNLENTSKTCLQVTFMSNQAFKNIRMERLGSL
jgi:hypothetical protein